MLLLSRLRSHLDLASTLWDKDEFFKEDIEALKAGAVEAQAGIEEPVTAAQRLQKRPKVTPMSKLGYVKRTDVAPMPANVQIFIISGMQGSGVHEFIRGAAVALRECGAAVVRINTDAFLGPRPDQCDICTQCCEKRPQMKKPHRCYMGPEALNTDWLNAMINREAEDIQHSAAFVNGSGKGIIILEGAYPLAVAAYHPTAGNTKWWFHARTTRPL